MAAPKILVIDDQLINIRLLELKLLRSDMVVLSATNGPDGLRIAREEKPNAVLLDIMMPGMSGIEVCRELKRDPATREIPVIFITARTGKEDKLEGFEAGAADYLIKPFELDEAVARIKTQLRIIQEHEDNIRLTRQLEQSRKQASIMHLTEGIAHNLNNLLGVLMGYIALLKRSLDKPEKILTSSERMETAIQRMTGIVHQLTVIGHFKSLQKTPVPLSRVLTGAVARFHRAASTDCPVQIGLYLPSDFTFPTNRELLEACLERLLSNAFESYGSLEEGRQPGEVTLEARLGEAPSTPTLKIQVLDRGCGIDPAIREGIFEPFVTTSSVVGKGMGLTIAQHSIQCLGGTIEVDDRPGGGTVATVALPITGEETGGEST